MKARNLLIGAALVLILFNNLPYLVGTAEKPPQGAHTYKIAYWIGFNIFSIIGFILLVIAFFIHKRVSRKRRKKMIDSLFN